MKAASQIKQFQLSSSIEVSQFLELFLENAGYSREKIIQYSFLIEEALIKWRDEFPSDTLVTVKRHSSAKNICFDLFLEGRKSDPFIIDSKAVLDKIPEEVMHDRLLSGVGYELKYIYQKGNNHLILELPLKTPEVTIFKRNLIFLMIPVVLQSLLNFITNYVDAFMLGFLDADSMSAVSLASSFCNIHLFLITGLCVAITTLVSQLWGKRDREGASCNINIAITVGLIISLIFAGASLFLPYQVMSFFTDVESIRILGVSYLRILTPSYFFISIYLVLYSVFRIMGKGSVALTIAIIGCGVNIIINAVLIFGLLGLPSLGISGAAIATITCQFVQCLACLVYSFRHKELGIKLSAKAVNIRSRLKAFFHIFIPTGCQYLSWIVATSIISMAFGHLGPDVIAANSVLLIVSGLIFSVREGIGSAAGIMVGALLGKNKLDEAVERSKVILGVGLKFGIVASLAFALISFLLRFLPLDLSESAIFYMNLMIITCSLNVFSSCQNGIINSGALYIGGDSKAVLIIDSAVMWGVMVPISIIGTFVFKFPIVFMALFLKGDEILSFPFKFWRYKQKKWVRNLTK